MPNIDRSTVHIVHFTSRPGGIELMLSDMIHNMSEYDFSVFVIRPPKSGEVNVYEEKCFPVFYGSASNVKAFYIMFRYARKHNRDRFHVFNIGPFFLLILKLAGVTKILYSIRGTVYWKKIWQKILRKPVWKLALSKRMRLIANSDFSRSIFSKLIGHDASLIDTVYNPLSPERFEFKNHSRSAADPFRIIYVGRLVPGKNLPRWLDIAAVIKDRFKNVEFYLYGDGPLKTDLQDISRRLGIADAVHFMGYIPDIAAAYQQADLFLFISEYESFGNAVVESVMCGTPVLAGAIPAMKEIFRDHPEFLIELDENLEKTVVKKLEDLESLEQLACSARESFIVRFGAEIHYKKLRRIYDAF